ncbi:hypothetical protein Zmor_002660 [Zophobas morio]|uniref:Serpin domain-containing protein n=1 Tax=Zophobas morio TaxID=2755281 RepID=A0AA38HKK0_9CUCU|nr:hypothetical protein Zmor_002660 [Zophobas morio]
MVLKRKLFFLLLTLVCAKSQTISDSLNAFTIDLLAATSRENGSPRNLALSPYTVWTLLSIIDEGAKDNTAKQLETVLRIPDASGKSAFRNNFRNLSNIVSAKDSGVNLDIYNSIFTRKDQTLKTEYRDVVRTNYDVNVQPIDFDNQDVASATINKYIAQATKNRITNFINPDDLAYASVFIVSALYFKGAWMQPFNPNQTRPDTFYDEKQNKLGEVDMMYQMNPFAYARLEWIRGYSVELPYGEGDKMSMILILPYKDQTVQGMLQLMTQEPFSKIINKLEKAAIDFEGDDVQVYLPRFKIESDLTLNAILQKMGVTDVFDEANANLLGMFEHFLYVTRLIQRAEIEVNEEGTVASAASGASVINKMPPPKFVANRPFLYFLVNKPTKSIMFAGKMTVPSKVAS